MLTCWRLANEVEIGQLFDFYDEETEGLIINLSLSQQLSLIYHYHSNFTYDIQQNYEESCN